MQSLKYALPVAAFVVLAGFLYVGLFLNPREVPSPFIGKPAPAFELRELRNLSETVSNADLIGKPSVMNVWATWCVSCRHEHPFLMQLARSGEVAIYGMNSRDDRNKALGWLRDLGDPYKKVAYDPDGAGWVEWGVVGSPETFLIDPAGTVVYKYAGPLSPAVWEREFRPRIAAMQASLQ
jgi:cytochrome c biogenesis protein CcmG, thiol:disulfide interchange protein DsbE